MGLSAFIGRARSNKGGKAEAAAEEPTMKCGSCGAKMTDGEESCAKCGAKSGKGAMVECPECHKETAADAEKCGSCGAKLEASDETEEDDGVGSLVDALDEMGGGEETETPDADHEATETPEEEAVESEETQEAEEEEGTESLAAIPAEEGGAAAMQTAEALAGIGDAIGEAVEAARSGDSEAMEDALEAVAEELEELRDIADEEADMLDGEEPEFDADKAELKDKKKKGMALSAFVKSIG